MIDMDILNYKAPEIYRDAVLLKELCRVYREIFGEGLQTSCENCVADGLFRVRYHTTNKKDKKMEEKKKCNFRLMEDDVMFVKAWGKHITNDNLTDEIAINLLKISDKLLCRFVVHPDNISEIMGWGDKSKEEPKTEKPKLESVPTLSELLSLTRAELIAKAESYPSKITFTKGAAKTEIANALIDRLILDAE